MKRRSSGSSLMMPSRFSSPSCLRCAQRCVRAPMAVCGVARLGCRLGCRGRQGAAGMIWRGSLCPTIVTHGALYPCPQVIAPLIHERDAYLAWALKRSKAVNGNARIVGVVSKW